MMNFMAGSITHAAAPELVVAYAVVLAVAVQYLAIHVDGNELHVLFGVTTWREKCARLGRPSVAIWFGALEANRGRQGRDA
jgi:hypothetical protein